MESRFEYDKKEIGRRLRYYRKKSKLSAEDVREYLSLGSVQAIYKWENGVTIPAVDNFLALMELYGIDSFSMIAPKKIEVDSNRLIYIECYKSKKSYCVYSA